MDQQVNAAKTLMGFMFLAINRNEYFMSELRVIFPDDNAREHFMNWFEGCGEQDFSCYLEFQENISDFSGMTKELNSKEGIMVIE